MNKHCFAVRLFFDEDKSIGAEQAGWNSFNSKGEIPMTANTTQSPSLTITLMNLLTPILCEIRRPLAAPCAQGDLTEP